MQDYSTTEVPHHWRLSKQVRSPETTILLRRHLDHLSLSLQPLMSITTGTAHPDFPKTLLHYHILTEAQLDSLAQFYHQRTPSIFSFGYPEPVVARWNANAGIEEKRRRFGRFVGLRGCESPEKTCGLELDQLVLERWLEERVRQTAAHEQLINTWRAKRC